MSRVGHIVCYSAKGIPGLHMEKVNLIKDIGMQGDYHADGGERQITLISQKAKDWMQSQEIDGLCFAKFKENIVIEGIISGVLPEQGKLAIGEALLELTPYRKKCYPKHCKLDQSKVMCKLIQEVRFAKVIAGGTIAVGMEVVVSEI